MEISASGLIQMQQAVMIQAKDVAMVKKSIDVEKDMADQLLAGITQNIVDHDAAAGNKVNMIA